MKSHVIGGKQISLAVAFVPQGEQRKRFSWVITPKCWPEGSWCSSTSGNMLQFQNQSLRKRMCFLPFSRVWDEPENRTILSISEIPLGQPGLRVMPSVGEDLALKHSCLSQLLCSRRAVDQGTRDNTSLNIHFKSSYSYMLIEKRWNYYLFYPLLPECRHTYQRSQCGTVRCLEHHLCLR